jgi:hypothetical protein
MTNSRGKIKLSLCLPNEAPRLKDVGESGDPWILDLAQVEIERAASCFGPFTLGRSTCVLERRLWEPSSDLEDMENREICSYRDSKSELSIVHPAKLEIGQEVWTCLELGQGDEREYLVYWLGYGPEDSMDTSGGMGGKPSNNNWNINLI